MPSKHNNLSHLTLGATLIVAACAGNNLNDVGDVDGEGGQGIEVGDPGGHGGEDSLGMAGTKGTPMPSGGTGGTTQIAPGGSAGAPDQGGAPLIEELDCEGCELIAEGSEIRAVATTPDRVYWVEYGTLDDLGNHQGDGRLLSATFETGEPVAIATDLEGPMGVEVGGDYAYVLVERSNAPNGAMRLLRISLDTGSSEILQNVGNTGISDSDIVYDWFHRYFLFSDGIAYWGDPGGVRYLAESNAGPAASLPLTNLGDPTFALTGDESLLYIMDYEGLKSLPYAGGDGATLHIFASDFPLHEQLSASGEYIYALDAYDYAGDAQDSYLVRMPKTGDAWERVAENSAGAAHLRLHGETYFVDPPVRSRGQNVGCSIVQGTAADASAEVVLLRSPLRTIDGIPIDCLVPWDIAPTWVYLGIENQLYRAPRAP